ncbi:hypothetical protein PIB30_006338 [Stylosanthes scabra]|uniref:Uncharacterized protein n=1 Tax=Stylosanthes scabra TaxID=79078 RepID=A0ABU6R4V3_9FABA|nr:hypothetical protein [Stylosanthes scabra]
MENRRGLSKLSHSKFFSSLKQVEKRLKLEQTTASVESVSESESSCSAMFLGTAHAYGVVPQDSSEPPLGFLSVLGGSTASPPCADGAANNSQLEEANDDDDDDIERLMQLLGLSEEEQWDDALQDGGSCHCEGGFHSKIVGVVGPKCSREVKRLDGWINHFLNGGGEDKLEPLRLAHLLLGKAAFVSGDLEFPSTIQEFLHNDPPAK